MPDNHKPVKACAVCGIKVGELTTLKIAYQHGKLANYLILLTNYPPIIGQLKAGRRTAKQINSKLVGSDSLDFPFQSLNLTH